MGLPPSNRKPTNKPAENIDVEEQFENDDMGTFSREARQELAEGQEPDGADTESDVEDAGIEDNHDGEISDSDLEQYDDEVDSDGSDVDHFSF